MRHKKKNRFSAINLSAGKLWEGEKKKREQHYSVFYFREINFQLKAMKCYSTSYFS